jgi:class 3 adenylate cyclase
MIVDDEEPNRLLLRDPLEHHGYEVTEAVSGVDALRLIAQRPPDAILLDVMMPRMDGFQLCRRLKMDRQTAHIPVLLVTALADRKERLLGMKAGANDFLNKPVDLQDLVLRVGNAVYAKTLYDQLLAEREKSDRLLFDTLPQPIAERIKRGELNIADSHADVTVLVADLAGFTNLAANVSPDQIVLLLNEIFTGFDLLAEEHGLEKIKTMGDAYLAAAGLPVARRDHAAAAANMAIGMRTVIDQFNRRYQTSLRLRIGINTGTVIAGVIGRPRFAYDLWGNTVNVACRLEALADPDTILVGPDAAEQLKNHYRLAAPRQIELKNKIQITASELAGRL